MPKTGTHPTEEVAAGAAESAALARGVVVHYHEIGLKGRNRGFFEKRLLRNLAAATEGCERGETKVLTGRFLMRTPREPSEALLRRIGTTFGVAAYAPCVVTPAEIENLVATALQLLAGRRFETFAVAARRATKEHPLTSRDINVQLGKAIQDRTGAGVNLGAPDVTVHVEVVGGRALVYLDRHIGPGGLPVGVSGTVMCLLSGGIDSPVAVHRMLKRGAKAVLCHFHSAPFTDLSSARKAEELARKIAVWQGDTTLHLVPLGKAQQQVVVAAPPDLRVVLYRRLMARIASELARRHEAKVLVTGDSLGQVASQTLENMLCVDDASPLTILRPLVGADKQEIVDEARRVGTYELSIQPYADCCSLFVPRSPATRAELWACARAESELDVAALVASCVEETETLRVQRPPCGAEDGG